MSLEIALYQPDMAPNAATIGRLCACLGMKLTIIEPAGFAYTESGFRRAGMDYLDNLDLARASNWQAFLNANGERRIVLLTTKFTLPYTKFMFAPDDILLLGRESAGVPQSVHEALPDRIGIPMAGGRRSLNVALAAAMVTGEALRQMSAFPND